MREELKFEILNRIDLFVSNMYGRRLQNLPEYIVDLERELESKETEVKDTQSELDRLSQLTDAEVIDNYLSIALQDSSAIYMIKTCQHLNKEVTEYLKRHPLYRGRARAVLDYISSYISVAEYARNMKDTEDPRKSDITTQIRTEMLNTLRAKLSRLKFFIGKERDTIEELKVLQQIAEEVSKDALV